MIVKSCFKSVERYCGNMEIIRIDQNNFSDYTEIPSWMMDKVAKGSVSLAHFSDFLRTLLLLKYGGMWIDATVMLTDEIDATIKKAPFFFFANPLFLNFKHLPSNDFEKVESHLGNVHHLGSNWFIKSRPNNELLQIVLTLLEEFYTSKKGVEDVHDYFIFHDMITYAVLNNRCCLDIFSRMPKLSNKIPHLLQAELGNPFDSDVFDTICGLSSIHKLTYKFPNDYLTGNTFAQHIINGVNNG